MADCRDQIISLWKAIPRTMISLLKPVLNSGCQHWPIIRPPAGSGAGYGSLRMKVRLGDITVMGESIFSLDTKCCPSNPRLAAFHVALVSLGYAAEYLRGSGSGKIVLGVLVIASHGIGETLATITRVLMGEVGVARLVVGVLETSGDQHVASDVRAWLAFAATRGVTKVLLLGTAIVTSDACEQLLALVAAERDILIVLSHGIGRGTNTMIKALDLVSTPFVRYYDTEEPGAVLTIDNRLLGADAIPWPVRSASCKLGFYAVNVRAVRGRDNRCMECRLCDYIWLLGSRAMPLDQLGPLPQVLTQPRLLIDDGLHDCVSEVEDPVGSQEMQL